MADILGLLDHTMASATGTGLIDDVRLEIEKDGLAKEVRDTSGCSYLARMLSEAD